MRGLFKWAKEAKHVAIDPTIDVKNPKRRKGPGFPVWTEEDAAAYDKRWPLGTKERVWRDVLFYTGLRRGDAVILGRQHVRDGVATLRTEKSQGEMIVCIPILPILQHTLDAGPTGELAFICGKNGKPLTKESFRQCLQRCVPGCRTVQSLCTRLSQDRSNTSSRSTAQLLRAQRDIRLERPAMAALYTEAADRKRLALDAMTKVQGRANETATSSPHLMIR